MMRGGDTVQCSERSAHEVRTIEDPLENFPHRARPSTRRKMSAPAAAAVGEATTYRLFVGGVPETITSAELAQRFSRFGEVVEVQLAPPLAGSDAAPVAPAGATSALCEYENAQSIIWRARSHLDVFQTSCVFDFVQS